MAGAEYMEGFISACVRTAVDPGKLVKSAGSNSAFRAYRSLIPHLKQFISEKYGPVLKGLTQSADSSPVFSSGGRFIPPRMVSPLHHNVGISVEPSGLGRHELKVVHHTPAGELLKNTDNVGTYRTHRSIYQQADQPPDIDYNRKYLDNMFRKLFVGRSKFTKGNASAMTDGRTITTHGSPHLSASLEESGRQGAFDPVATVAHEVGHTAISPYLAVPESLAAIKARLLDPARPRMAEKTWNAARDYDLSLAGIDKAPKNLPYNFAGDIAGADRPVGISERMADLFASDFKSWTDSDPARAAAYSRAKRMLGAKERGLYARLVQRGVIPEVQHPAVRPVHVGGPDALSVKIPAVQESLSPRQINRSIPKSQRRAARQVDEYEESLDKGFSDAMNLY